MSDTQRFQLERSGNRWRIEAPDGSGALPYWGEATVWSHAMNREVTTTVEYVNFRTKEDAVARLAEYAWECHLEVQRLRAELEALKIHRTASPTEEPA